MFLAIDIGNSNIKTGLFEGDLLIESKIFNEFYLFNNYLKLIKIEKSAISSVVPSLSEKVSEVLLAISHLSPFVITIESKFNLNIRYNSLVTLGIDRICSAEGAFYLFKNSEDFNKYNEQSIILTLDFGTATTINVIKYPGEFSGGIIAPGISMMFDSLKYKTAQLPNVTLEEYKELIGNNTTSSIASGVLNSQLGLIDRVIKKLQSDIKVESTKIFITGGNAEKLFPYFRFEYQYVKELVLLGIKTAYEKNLDIRV